MAANKLIVLCLVLSAFQFTNALEERSVIGDIVNNTVSNLQNLVKGLTNPIVQRIEDGISNVGNLIKNATTKVEEVVSNVVGTATNLSNAFVSKIQTEVQKAVQLGKNVTSCSVEGLQKAANIVSTARTNVRSCTNTALQPAQDLGKDLADLLKMTVQMSFNIPGQVIGCFSSGLLGVLSCETQLAANLTSRASMLASATAADFIKLGTMAVSLPISIGQCEAGGLSYVTTQFTALTVSSLNCIKNGPSA